ncbi:MAG: hypothetical protein JSV43_01530 [Methanobacteriota archaeon]|nr:MAG: hypothetical protein JSV43_01530 [Euryarchaeota archaeon]
MDLTSLASILWLILVIVILLIVVSLPLYITARWLDEDRGFLRALGTTLLLIISFVLFLLIIPYAIINLIIAIIINLLIIKYAYDTDWGKAFAMWIVAIVVAVLILILIEFLLGLGLLVLTS